jgi:RNA polymerase sigma factor (sigma-70 family)
MEGRSRLQELIETEHEQLVKTLGHYIFYSGLTNGSGIETLAEELLNEVVVEALRHAHRLKPDVHPKAWLLGIAINLIKRRQSDLARRERREPLIRDLLNEDEMNFSDDELFEQLPNANTDNVDDWEAKEDFDQLLAQLPRSEGDLLRLAYFHDMSGEALAEMLHIQPAAARMRLHRAIRRLRSLIMCQRDNKHV